MVLDHLGQEKDVLRRSQSSPDGTWAHNKLTTFQIEKDKLDRLPTDTKQQLGIEQPSQGLKGIEEPPILGSPFASAIYARQPSSRPDRLSLPLVRNQRLRLRWRSVIFYV